jgi:hypothetical protein
VALICGADLYAAGRPAPPPSRYSYTLKIDPASLPKGVTVRAPEDGKTSRYVITNTSDVPLVRKRRIRPS